MGEVRQAFGAAARGCEAELRAAEARFAATFAAAPTGIALADLSGSCLQANAAMAQMFGCAPDELVGRPGTEFVPAEDCPAVAETLAALAAGTADAWHGERRLRALDGSTFWALVTLTAVQDDDGRPAYLVVHAHDVTARRSAEDALAHHALHDPLTGLPNRSLLLDRLEHALDRARREPTHAALLFVDLDRFKPVNDSLGHAAGDIVLVEIARRLGDAVRAGDTVARLGGDEFVVFAERLDAPEAAVQVAQRAVTAIRRPIEVAGHVVHLDASVGIAFADGAAGGAEDLLRNADAAKDAAKQRRLDHALFDAHMRARSQGRLELETGLRRALRTGEIGVHYQPQVDLASGEAVGVEALARWEDPRRGLVLPGEFVPLAEETGLIEALGDRVLDVACRDAARWVALDREEIVVGVNLSASQFAGPDLVERVAGVLRRAGLPPERLCLEITETAVMRDVQAARTTLDALKGLGVQIAIDDFGTGYSSLSYLTRFPVDVLKIDRSFVQGLGRADEAALVAAIIAMGHALGVTIVAEGVETAEQADELGSLACDVAQGHRFGRAQDHRAIDGLLRSGRRFGPRLALTAEGA